MIARFVATFEVTPVERHAVADMVSSTAKNIGLLVDYLGPAGVGFSDSCWMLKLDGPSEKVRHYSRWFDGQIGVARLYALCEPVPVTFR